MATAPTTTNATTTTMTTMPVGFVFNTDFKRYKSKNGMVYMFQVVHPTEVSQGLCTIEGEVILSADEDTESKCKELPEEVRNPERLGAFYTQWLKDCRGSFVRPPTLTQCLSNTTFFLDISASCATISPEEEEDDWLLLWVPTSLKLHPPQFSIGWAPLYKKKYTRIPILSEFDSQDTKEIHTIHISKPDMELQTNTTRLSPNEYPEELKDLQIPYSADLQPLRLHDAHQDKLRKKVHDARIRLKLARYRADRLAQTYERKYGVWPEEDREEAQTEVESDSDNEEEVDV